MNRTTVLIWTAAVIALVTFVECYFKPRIDVTSNKDVLLWYYNSKRERVYVLLFNLH